MTAISLRIRCNEMEFTAGHCRFPIGPDSVCGTAIPPRTGPGQTQRAVTANSGVATDLFEFRRNGNVFTLLRNGVSFLTWTDTCNLVSTGSTNRRWGFLVEGNYPIFNAEFRSPAVNSIEAFDL
ncbi:hypothetical protein [Nocardia sp. NPDC060249]|uniref:DUF7257 domain-containing protein n=1 Tax=Nocardia sp. NPDC060249 TaxID=3347082 RepID=UPI00365F4B3A